MWILRASLYALTHFIDIYALPVHFYGYDWHYSFFTLGFAEVSADLVEAAIAHCQVIVVSRWVLVGTLGAFYHRVVRRCLATFFFNNNELVLCEEPHWVKTILFLVSPMTVKVKAPPPPPPFPPEMAFCPVSFSLLKCPYVYRFQIFSGMLPRWWRGSPRFIEKVQQDIPGNGVKEQLQILCFVYALHLLHKHSGEFLSTGCITPEQAALANEQLRALYSQVGVDESAGETSWGGLPALLVLGRWATSASDPWLRFHGRFVRMQSPWLMPSTTPTIIWVLLSVAMMGMSTRLSMPRPWKIPSMTPWCLMDTTSSFDQFWSKLSGFQGCRKSAKSKMRVSLWHICV